jgi:very-short-patch-repair endonuclease
MRTRLRSGTKERARELRRAATPAEKILWRKLRELKPLGLHFRRQVPFRAYILDFVEHTRKLVIEVDGDTHAATDSRVRDKVRDQILKSEGYCVLRLWNFEVRENVDGIVEKILSEFSGRPPVRPG